MKLLLLTLAFIIVGGVAGWFANSYVAKLVETEIPEEGANTPLRSKKTKLTMAICCAVFAGLSALLFAGSNIWLAIISALASIVLVCVAASDLCHYIIFDRFQLAFGILAIAKIAVSLLTNTLGSDFWVNAAFGFSVGLLVYGGIALIGSKILGKDAMGWGDVKLAACSGLFLGWQNFLLSTLISALSASIILLVLAKRRGDEKHKEYPYAPFIVIGNLIAMFAGNVIINAYMSLFGMA